jgi:hypothetical protein
LGIGGVFLSGFGGVDVRNNKGWAKVDDSSREISILKEKGQLTFEISEMKDFPTNHQL